MSSTVIKVENLFHHGGQAKFYRLGTLSGFTSHVFTHHASCFTKNSVAGGLANAASRIDPLLKIGQADHGNQNGDFIWALREINFEVKQGGALSIIGKNSTGKSTILIV